MAELRPGVFSAVFAKLGAEGQIRGRIALEPVALAIERQAKINASNGSHKYGTPTPARPGEGPARISGTLRRSISHSPAVQNGTGWEMKVGTAVGFEPPYGKTKTPANRYGFYLETGLRNGSTYPFLEPAFRFVVSTVAPQIYKAAYGKGWKQLA